MVILSYWKSYQPSVKYLLYQILGVSRITEDVPDEFYWFGQRFGSDSAREVCKENASTETR